MKTKVYNNIINPFTGKKTPYNDKNMLGESFEKSSIILNASSRFHITPISSYIWSCDSNWSQKPRSLGNAMWYFVIDGEINGYLYHKENKVKLKSGQLIIIPPGVEHAFENSKNKTMRLNTTHFFASIGEGLDLLAIQPIEKIMFDQNNFFMNFCTQLAQEFFSKQNGHLTIMANIIENILLSCLRNQISTDGHLSTAIKEYQRLQKVFEFIEKNLHRSNLKISELANILHVSETQLRKIFQHALQLSPLEYINNKKIEKACILLKTSDKPIKNIATICGFTNVTFFHRTFKKSTHKTPAQYRSSYLQ